MLVKPPLEKLLPKTENRYTLAILVAKRARQLVDGAQPLYESSSPNLVTVASEELGENMICGVEGIVKPHIPLRPEVEAARLAAKKAAAQSDLADAVREELERTTAIISGTMDHTDVQILSESLLNPALAGEQAEQTMPQSEQAPAAEAKAEEAD